jgi:alpha-ribazole phosphatase
MTTLLLIRHGETDWNSQQRWQGQADVPLNERGIQQAAEIARSLSQVKIRAIYASDLQRAMQTARAIAEAKGLPVQIDIRLREIHQGEWQGLHIAEIQARYAQEFQLRQADPLHVAPPGGETALEVRDRAAGVLDEIIEHYPHGTVAVVSHGFTIAIILVHCFGIPVERVWELVPKNGTVVRVEDAHSCAQRS